ncbi:MAG: hypothetical protein K6C10_11700 [Prevotella sp.]|nr:hypothetical protein [Prevotella sp.]
MKHLRKLALVALLLTSALSASAGSVTMKTGRDVGSTISIAVNAGIPLTLKWGDGTVEEVNSTGVPQEFTVKSASLTLSSDKDITSLYVAENELSELNVTGIATTLRRLFCADNNLTALNLSSCTELVSLDCQGNKLTALNLVSTQLVDLNEADNRLAATGLRGGTSLTSIICANNRLTALNYVGNQTGLEKLFFQGNKVSSTTLSRCEELTDVLGFDNSITTFNAAALSNLENLWIGNNRLTSLTLSEDVALVCLCAPGNKLAELTIPTSSKNSLKFVDLSENYLFFNSFPTIYKSGSQTYSVEGAVSPQNPYHLFDDMNINERSEQLTNILGRNTWSAPLSLTLTFKNGAGEELVSGTDYTYSGYRITFLKPHTGVVITATSPHYPDVELSTEPIDVFDPTGIEQVETSSTSLENATIYDIQGRSLGNRQPQKGIYIVNGKKVVIK